MAEYKYRITFNTIPRLPLERDLESVALLERCQLAVLNFSVYIVHYFEHSAQSNL